MACDPNGNLGRGGVKRFSRQAKEDGADPTHPLALDGPPIFEYAVENGGPSYLNYEGAEAIETFVSRAAQFSR